MKIGDIFSYKVKNKPRIIRKEEKYYITYIPEEMCFYELADFPFQIIKHTSNNTIHILIEKTSKNYGISSSEVKKIINAIQKELIEKHLLEEQS